MIDVGVQGRTLRRVVVVGPGGSGKSTLARRLGDRLQLPVIHMDAEFWRPAWQQPSQAEWEQRVEQLVRGEAWVMDGAHRDSLHRALTRAEVVVVLDPTPIVIMLRLLVRRCLGRRRADLRLPERLTRAFLIETWTYRRRLKPDVVAAARASRIELIVLHNSAHVETWLAAFGGRGKA